MKKNAQTYGEARENIVLAGIEIYVCDDVEIIHISVANISGCVVNFLPKRVSKCIKLFNVFSLALNTRSV